MSADETARGLAGRSGEPATGRIQSARLFCENCRAETAHRVLRLTRSSSRSPGDLQGVARCRVCRWTHPFETQGPRTVATNLIISLGPASRRTVVRLPESQPLAVDSMLPGEDRPLRVRRLEGRDGSPRATALPAELASVWAVEDRGIRLPVSVVEGRQTWTAKLEVERGARYAVGERIQAAGAAVVIVALRARGRTWRRAGDQFGAEEIQRVYGRRTVSPPAGSRDWRTPRPTPSSRESSASRSARIRSSPGVRRTRTTPRRRRALGGAVVHRVSPS